MLSEGSLAAGAGAPDVSEVAFAGWRRFFAGFGRFFRGRHRPNHGWTGWKMAGIRYACI
jgi:hypothetical protein